jgi:hypothetical protein
LSQVRFRRYDGVGREPCPPRLTRMTRTFQNGREPWTDMHLRLERHCNARNFCVTVENGRKAYSYTLRSQNASARVLSRSPHSCRFCCLFPRSLRRNLDRTSARHLLSPAALVISCIASAGRHRGKGFLLLAFSLYIISLRHFLISCSDLVMI